MAPVSTGVEGVALAFRNTGENEMTYRPVEKLNSHARALRTRRHTRKRKRRGQKEMANVERVELCDTLRDKFKPKGGDRSRDQVQQRGFNKKGLERTCRVLPTGAV